MGLEWGLPDELTLSELIISRAKMKNDAQIDDIVKVQKTATTGRFDKVG